MCVEPTTAFLIASAVGTALSATSNAISSSAEKKVEKYNIQMIEQQAKIAERNAAYERQEGIDDARRQRLKAIQNMNAQKTAIASGNIMLSSSTALSLFDYEKLNGELNAIDILNSSERRAQSYLDSAENYYQRAGLQSFKNKEKEKANIFGNLGNAAYDIASAYNPSLP